MIRFPCVLLLAHLLYTNAWAKTVQETLRITWDEGAPNGQSRQLIHTNGQFPSPTLVWDEGDDVEVTVINNMDKNVTVHWHGLDQKNSPWADGTPGLSQRPIQPGKEFVYKFKASPPGNHWYHSHEKMSLVDGLYGAIHIRPKQNRTGLWSQIVSDQKDIEAMEKAARDPEYLVVSDWSQYTSEEYWKISTDSGMLIFCLDSILVNGKGELYCPGQKFLESELAPGLVDDAFPPGTQVSDKGCFPANLDQIQGGPWNITKRPDLIPPRVLEGCVPSKHENASIVVDPKKNNGWVSMHIVAAATIAQIAFSIDEHEFWLYEVDGNYVNPKKFVSAVMSAGETFSIMVKLDKKPGKYTMRIPNSGVSQVLGGYAEMIYDGHWQDERSEKPYLSFGGNPVSPEVEENSYFPWQLDTDHMSPWPANKPRPGKADEEHLLAIGRVGAPYNYTMNTKYLYPVDFQNNDPLLFYPNATIGTENENLVIRTKNGSWVDLILQVSTLPGDTSAFEHFIHKHGSKTWRIGFGTGVWNYTSVEEAIKERPKDFNLETPGLRDTWLTAFSVSGEAYWSVFRYYVDNPGPWLFHCHIELHFMGGMGIAILDGVDAWPENIPSEYKLD
ncbi:multicopper oxidase [Trichoderma asperellum CBS 433.97]|uniref:Multicopper oxidase n=3 Tax=Trichoderma asperellum TaxID=101201 RepID=A0A2T3YRH2_TRIA4|nr:multicopper oxidase [Trichoderma asperellum CBS 433.97]PTB35116.1 multicopper oxidase [Trichoderma asperellum CBS 433.97]